MPLTNSQVDKLGDRLREAAASGEPVAAPDRQLLLEFRASFLPAYQSVVGRIREAASMNPSGRPEKTPESIVAKLAREHTKLSRMQDIAGCRIVVSTRANQDQIVATLQGLFPDSREVDRRLQPSHGYRAVHLIVRDQGRPVEIQVRTMLQDLWANAVEASADLGGDLKHGVEPPSLPGMLAVMEHVSAAVAELEAEGQDHRAFNAEPSLSVPPSVNAPTRELADLISKALLSYYQLGLFRGILTSGIMSYKANK